MVIPLADLFIKLGDRATKDNKNIVQSKFGDKSVVRGYVSLYETSSIASATLEGIADAHDCGVGYIVGRSY